MAGVFTRNLPRVDGLRGGIETIEIFPQQIWKTKLNLNLADLTKRCEKARYDPRIKSTIKSNIGGWQSYEEMFQEGHGFEDVRTELCHAHLNLQKTVGINGYWALNAMWININFPHSQNCMHDHLANPNIGHHNLISGVIWVKTPPNSGDLRMYNCRCQQEMWEFFEDSEHVKNSMYYDIQPEDGMCYMFNASKQHGVTENLSGENRISISFNFEILDGNEAKKYGLQENAIAYNDDPRPWNK